MRTKTIVIVTMKKKVGWLGGSSTEPIGINLLDSGEAEIEVELCPQTGTALVLGGRLRRVSKRVIQQIHTILDKGNGEDGVWRHLKFLLSELGLGEVILLTLPGKRWVHRLLRRRIPGMLNLSRVRAVTVCDKWRIHITGWLAYRSLSVLSKLEVDTQL